MPNDQTYPTSAGGPATGADELPRGLTRWEQAEAEAEADVLDVDLESCGARQLRVATVVPPQVVPRFTEISESDLAEAECETDLSHVDEAA